LHAKKTKQSRSKQATSVKKGFGEVKIIPTESNNTSSDANINYDRLTTTVSENSKTAQADTNQSELTFDELIKKYNIKDGNTRSEEYNKNENIYQKNARKPAEERPFGASVLANFPEKGLQTIDKVLVTGTFLALSVVILCGISISLGAFKVVFPDQQIPEFIEGLIQNVLSPSFTPSLFVFFFFSITYGLFKFAQISSSTTVYTE
jgi:hypothetical protein